MSDTVGSAQNRAMVNGDGDGGLVRAPRPPTASRWHRRLLALGVSLVATLGVAVPLAYQAHEARTVDVRPAPSRTRPSDPPAAVLPTTTINTVPELRWASATGTVEGAPLDGATVRDEIWVTLDIPDAVRVEFWIDPGRRLDAPAGVDDRAPFTLSTAGSRTPGTYDTHRLDDGDHRIEVLVVSKDGVQLRLVSRFRVANG